MRQVHCCLLAAVCALSLPAFLPAARAAVQPRYAAEDVVLYRNAQELYNRVENRQENRSLAYEEFKKVLNLHPESPLAPEALYYMIKISEACLPEDNTLRLLRRMNNQFPNSNHQKEVRAKLAELLCRQAESMVRDFPAAASVRAVDEAIQKMLEARRVDPESRAVRMALETVYMRKTAYYEEKNDLRSAVRTLEHAIRHYPEFAYAYLHLALLYEKNRQEQKAIAMYETAAKHYPDFPGYLPLGKLYLKRKDYRKAAEALEKAAAALPQNEEVYRSLSFAYAQLKKDAEKEAALRQAEHIRQWGYVDRGKNEHDIEGWLKLIEQDPRPVYYYNLAALYESQGNAEEAYKFFKNYQAAAKSDKPDKQGVYVQEKKFLNAVHKHANELKRKLGIKEHSKPAVEESTGSEDE